jgi:hypothetical protein
LLTRNFSLGVAHPLFEFPQLLLNENFSLLTLLPTGAKQNQLIDQLGRYRIGALRVNISHADFD